MNYKYEKEAVKKFGSQYKRNNSKKHELIFPCPNCSKPGKSDKLYVNTLNGVYHCFRCDLKGKLHLRYNLQDVKNYLENNKIKKDVNKTLYLMPFTKYDLTEEQKQALYNRGLTDDDISYYNITGGKRIQIPNFVKGNLTDIVCLWEWRKDRVTDHNPKYLYEEGVKKSNTLFNIYNIENNVDNITLCEGIFNAITAGKTSVASYGRSLSECQLQLILDKSPKSITIAYDSDEPGVTGALKVIEDLNNAKYQGLVYYILLPKNKDINDLGKEKYKEYVKENIININLSSKLSRQLPKFLFENR